MSTILTYAGDNCNEYRQNFRAGEVRYPRCCPTCLHEALERNGYYRNRQVKATSPVDVPAEYPEPVELIDLIRLRCKITSCPQRYHTVLPSFLSPYGHFPHSIRQTVMDAADQGATVYSLASQLRLFPHLIRRWKQEGEELAGRVVGPILAKVREISPGSGAAGISGKSWGCLVPAVLVLVTVLCRDSEVRWSKDHLLEFVYLFCSERRELRFWDRPGRRRKESPCPITVALPAPDPG